MSRVHTVLAALLLVGCGGAAGDPAPAPESFTPTGDSLKNCQGKASAAVPGDGTYVLTTFGGPSEPQPLACGGNSKSGSWYYAASKQRYGCGSHIQISANGNCVVAQTDDYGPDVCVEKAAGYPIIDASPLVSKALFGASSLGWSDEKKVQVVEVPSSTPLGPCSNGGGAGGSGGNGAGGSSAGGSSAGGSSAGGSSSGGSSSGGSSAGGSSSGGSSSGGSSAGGSSGASSSCLGVCGSQAPSGCWCDSGCKNYGDCCADIDSACGSSGGGGTSGAGGSSGGSGSGGGAACASDGQCNPGTDGSGLICVGGQCVPGCHQNWQCPGNTTCVGGQCQ